MNSLLTDAERIELAALCGGLADDRLTVSEKERLNAFLKSSEEARQFYVRHSALSASLFSYAAEMQSESPPMPVRKWQVTRIIQWAGAFSAAAAVLLIGAWWLHRGPANDSPSGSADPRLVALMTGTKDCEWSGAPMQAGSTLQAGQRLELTKGFAEITFDSGAQVTLNGPASMVVSSAWDASLESGTMQASVPAEAAGFRVTNPSVEVVDQGAEFSMIADASSAEVLVLKGQVEAAAPRDARTVLLREQESRRFAPEGTGEVRDKARKFARFAKVLTLDRHTTAGGYAHWAFDQSEGALLKAEAKGKKKKTSLHARMVTNEDAVSAATLTDGRWGRALSFDGRLYAKATVPGIASPGLARTLAFWVRVPQDAPLSGGGASILGWGEHARKHSAVTTRIGWNRFPGQGPVGALRTDLGHSVAMGSTSLRDGRWHHVAIILVPDLKGFLQAKQYVDGRLEGSTAKSFASRPPVEAQTSDTADTLWLGRSPGDRNKEGFFKGAMDELFVIDRALSPAEIVRLMRDNQPPETSLAEAF